MTLRASIDIGSNSILFLALDDKGKPVINEANVTGLGRGLDETKNFAPEAIEDSIRVFKNYADICLKNNISPESVIVTATEASRVAKNSQDFFRQIESDYGFKVKIITGEAEAYYSTIGVLADKNIEDEIITIMDIGGASTELIKVNTKSKEILESFSMPIGVVRLNNWQSKGSREQESTRVFTDFADRLNHVQCSKLYCVAGTMTSIGNMHLGHKKFIEDSVHGLNISFQDILKLREEFKSKEPEDILERFPFLGKRAQTINSGLYLAESILSLLKTQQVYISTYGLRYGTILSGGIKDGFIFKD